MKKYVKQAVLHVPHDENCKAIQWVKNHESPHPWNVYNIKIIRGCDENGNEVTFDNDDPENIPFRSFCFYEFSCGDEKCGAKKRILSASVAMIPEDERWDEIFKTINAGGYAKKIHQDAIKETYYSPTKRYT